jgi:hypothetical protein
VFYLEDANHNIQAALNEIERQGGHIQSVQHTDKLTGGYMAGVPGWVIVARRSPIAVVESPHSRTDNS